ncbi:MAG: hypothetical protein JKY34_12680 [Kordiimonadaceae bacterium]|nr:hypothetical protein [Kordiimonadaceae bacterium]
MTRSDIGPQAQLALAAETCRILPFVYLDIKGDSVFVWGGVDDLTWGGNTYKGIGTLGEISNVVSDLTGSISSVDIAINGIDPGLLIDAKSTNYKGRKATIWLGICDEKYDLIEDPALFVSGEMSAMPLSDNKQKGSIGITIESRAAMLRKNLTTLRTDEDHQRRHLGDLFFSFVPKVRQKTAYWGLQASGGNTGTRGAAEGLDAFKANGIGLFR